MSLYHYHTTWDYATAQYLCLVRDIAKLRKMIRLIYKAPNEDAVRWLLTDIAGSIL